MVNNIGAEFNHKIIRQHLSDGMTRQSYFLSKVVLGALVALICTLIVAIITIYFGLVNKMPIDNKEILEGVTKFGWLVKFFLSPWTIVLYFIQAFGFMMFAAVFAMFMKGHGMSSVFYIFYLILIENLLSWIISLVTQTDIGSLLPMRSVYSFFDVSKIAMYFAKDNMDELRKMANQSNLGMFLIGYKTAAISGLVWITALTFIFRYKVKNTDF
jgi:hypothetical protein